MTFAELLVVVSAEGFASRNVAVPIQLTAPTSWVGAAFINANRAMRERLWERVQANPGTQPASVKEKRPATVWVKPG